MNIDRGHGRAVRALVADIASFELCDLFQAHASVSRNQRHPGQRRLGRVLGRRFELEGIKQGLQLGDLESLIALAAYYALLAVKWIAAREAAAMRRALEY